MVLHPNRFWNSGGKKFLHGAKTPILIDFFPGQSGNFIAYAINLCVFGLNPGKDIFTDIGTIDPWNLTDDYVNNMQCFAAHWSDQDLEIPVPEKCTVIRILACDHISQLISVINLILRAGDRPYVSCGVLSVEELIRTLWYKFLNFSAPRWKQHDGALQYFNFSTLWNKNEFQNWMIHISTNHGQGPELKNLEIFNETYDLYLQKNHGLNIWQESGALLERYINDNTIKHFSTPFHDFAVFYRIISSLQLSMSVNDVNDLIIDCVDNRLDFQIARQAYHKYYSR